MNETSIGRRRTMLCGLSAIGLGALNALIWHRRRVTPSDVQQESTDVVLDRRRAELVKKLTAESAEESLSLLSSAALYYWPGVSSPFADQLVFPPPPDAGVIDVLRILSNRRFAKVVSDLKNMSQPKRREHVDGAMSRFLPPYQAAYSDFLVTLPQYAQAPSTGGFRSTPALDISFKGSDKPTLVGWRLGLLACLMLSAVLDSSTSKSLEVCEFARKQYFELAANKSLGIPLQMFASNSVSLYCRPVLSMSLLAAIRNAQRRQLGRSVLKHWRKQQLSPYDVHRNQFDLDAHLGVPQSNSVVEYPSLVTDEELSRLFELAT